MDRQTEIAIVPPTDPQADALAALTQEHPPESWRRWRRSGRIDLDEIAADRKHLRNSSEDRASWHEQVEALLPPNTCMLDGNAFKWTTPIGGWQLEIDSRLFDGPAVTVNGPPGKWQLADHRAEYVAEFLRLVGAIE